MGKLIISMAIFNSYVKLPEGMSQKYNIQSCFFQIIDEKMRKHKNTHVFHWCPVHVDVHVVWPRL